MDFFKAFDNIVRAVGDLVVVAWGFTGEIRVLVLKLLPANVIVIVVLGRPDSAPFRLVEGGKTGGPLIPIIYFFIFA